MSNFMNNSVDISVLYEGMLAECCTVLCRVHWVVRVRLFIWVTPVPPQQSRLLLLWLRWIPLMQ
jgi:hypothetical protein